MFPDGNMRKASGALPAITYSACIRTCVSVLVFVFDDFAEIPIDENTA